MVWIIYSKEVLSDHRPNALAWMMEEAEKLDLKCQIMFAEDFQLVVDDDLYLLHQNKQVPMPKAAFMRCYDLNLATHLEALGIKTFNQSQALQTSRNKWLTHLALSKNKVDSPKTILCHTSSDFDGLVDELSLPFILKDSF